MNCYAMYIYIQYIIWLYAYCFIQSVYTQRSMLQLCTCRFVSVSKCTYLSEYQDLNSPAVSSNRCPLSTFPYLSSSSTISAFIPHIFTHPPKLSTCRIIRRRGDVAWNDWPLSRWFISTLQSAIDVLTLRLPFLRLSHPWFEERTKENIYPNPMSRRNSAVPRSSICWKFPSRFWWFVGRWSFREAIVLAECGRLLPM